MKTQKNWMLAIKAENLNWKLFKIIQSMQKSQNQIIYKDFIIYYYGKTT